MSIYVISDLHLSFNKDKPMNIFGMNWDKHEDKIKNDWISKVNNSDTVLLLGDLSWAMNFEEVILDFEYINKLPGRKIILKGNHDYWWNTVSKINKFLVENSFNNIDILYNNSYLVEDKIICGTRGWTLLNTNEDDEKILKREAMRLEMSIKDGIDKYGTDKDIIVCMHYPPLIDKIQDSEFMEILKKYNVNKCFYGHLHAEAHKDAVIGKIDNIDFVLASCDYTDFKLIKI